MSEKPILIFPIEIKSREFPARLFLAGIAVENGFRVVLGRSKILHRKLYKFPRGIIIENDAQPRSFSFFARAQRMGFKTVAWDEESLVTLTDKIYAQLRICPKTIALTEHFFCRGRGDREAIKEFYPEIEGQLIEAGNPRLDILHPKWAGDIKKDVRKTTILINSRFSIVNPFYISPEKAKGNVFKKFGITKDSDLRAHVDGWLEHAQSMFLAFANLTEVIAQSFPEYRIIIRPHPSENHTFWLNLANKYQNCESFYEGTASDWFLTADCLVHNSCTTAIEASLIGLPAYSYLPSGDNIYDAELPNSVSRRFYDTDSIIEALRELPRLDERSRELTALKAREKLSKSIFGVQKSQSSDKIFSHIQEIVLPKFNFRMLGWRLYDAVRVNISLTKQYLISLKNRNVTLENARAGYANQKYPGISQDEITKLLEKFGYSHFKVTRFRDDWHIISRVKRD